MAPPPTPPAGGTTAAAVAEVFDRVRAGYPLLMLATPEERRWAAALDAAAPEEGFAVTRWSSASDARLIDHLSGLAGAADGPALHLLFDAGPDLADPRAARALREELPGLTERGAAVLLIAPRTPLPESLEADAADVDLPQPGPAELGEELAAAARGLDLPAPEAKHADRLVNAARGLTRAGGEAGLHPRPWPTPRPAGRGRWTRSSMRNAGWWRAGTCWSSAGWTRRPTPSAACTT